MKTIIKTILVVTLMFGTLISYANDNKESTNAVAVKRVKVEYKAVKKGNALTIKNEYGITIYKQVLQSSGNYTKTFDLTNLEDGLYTTELEKDFEIIVKKLEVKNGFVTFYKDENEIIFKPVIRTEGNLVMISKIEFEEKPLNVTLYYQNNIILSDEVSGEKVLNRVYKLSEFEKGTYKVVVNTNDRTYVKDFTI
ncbi:hypothetical protein QWY81_16345 [Polaribacter undariae]|uniref:Secretion system C-terminal sorting domain-containing protein n=1 Tax=Polaribacter sejongensis TaxID=985043 RepID=A0AAJ1QZ78_9FLAO|nr:hypothetical protein [Polaribacter undariae]MDN3621038.1 hypothetical protein [Polaribacter undariae]UWD31170.1 hypothetical protein NQP51_13620 [Polaribacter undariae]